MRHLLFLPVLLWATAVSSCVVSGSPTSADADASGSFSTIFGKRQQEPHGSGQVEDNRDTIVQRTAYCRRSHLSGVSSGSSPGREGGGGKREENEVTSRYRPIEDRTYQVWSNVHRDMKAGYTYFFVSAPPWEFDASRHDWLYQWLRPLIDLMGSPHVYLLVVEVFHEQCGRELRLVADGRYWDAYVNHLEFAAHLEDADLDVPTRVHEHAIWTWPDLEVGRRGIHHEFIKAVKTEPTITPFMLAASVRWQHKHPRFNGKNEASPAAYIEFILEEGLR